MGLPLDGARVLLTGASSGIGAALAPELAARGTRLVLVARRTDRLEKVAQRCRESGASEVVVLPRDLSDPAAATDVVREVEAAGGVDVLVNNAGAPMRGRSTRSPSTRSSAPCA